MDGDFFYSLMQMDKMWHYEMLTLWGMSSVQLEVGEDEELNAESSLCSMDRQNIYPHYLYMDLITHAQHARPCVAPVRAYLFCPHLSVFLAIDM